MTFGFIAEGHEGHDAEIMTDRDTGATAIFCLTCEEFIATFTEGEDGDAPNT